MLAFWSGLFIVLHGLVHLWYVVLSQKLVAFQPEMGWTGRSWLLTNVLGDSPTRLLAGLLYVLATIGMVVSGIGVMARGEWWRPVLIGSTVLSSVTLLLFWDGSTDLIVQKGLLGLVINGAILIALAVL
jgi:hypothetical protein